jgi:hypothetical protein
MANLRLTDITLAGVTAITPSTLIHIVTTADTSQYSGGSSYAGTLGQIYDGLSGYCVSDIYVSNVHSCSPLNINPLDEGNVYFGSTSGVTIDVLNIRLGIGTSSPTETLDISGTTKTTNLSATTITASTFNLNGFQVDDAWTSYVPTWTASVNPSIGNGTIEGYYKVIGKTCFFRGNIAMGTTTTYGTGEWLVGVPFPAKNADGIQITVSILQASVAWYNGIMNGARAGYTDKTAIQYQNVGGTTDSLSANTPFVWGTGSRFTWNGSYEIA